MNESFAEFAEFAEYASSYATLLADSAVVVQLIIDDIDTYIDLEVVNDEHETNPILFYRSWSLTTGDRYF